MGSRVIHAFGHEVALTWLTLAPNLRDREQLRIHPVKLLNIEVTVVDERRASYGLTIVEQTIAVGVDKGSGLYAIGVWYECAFLVKLRFHSLHNDSGGNSIFAVLTVSTVLTVNTVTAIHAIATVSTVLAVYAIAAICTVLAVYAIAAVSTILAINTVTARGWLIYALWLVLLVFFWGLNDCGGVGGPERGAFRLAGGGGSDGLAATHARGQDQGECAEASCCWYEVFSKRRSGSRRRFR